jgi:fluoride exporter
VTILLVAGIAAVGAPLRYLADRAVQARHDSVFPWGTLTVNVVGSLLLGIVIGLPADSAATVLLGSGFCGALTTYSTFSYETLRLIQTGARLYALTNIIASLMAGLGAGFAGLTLAHAITG